MRVWTQNTFEGHCPVGTAAVIVADTRQQAARFLADKLAAIGLPQNVDPDTLREVDCNSPGVHILCDGNY